MTAEYYPRRRKEKKPSGVPETRPFFLRPRRLISTLPRRDVSLAVQTEANNYFHALTRVCIHVRGTMACIAIPPTALRMPIIIQFDVCRNNAVSRDSVKRELERGAKRPAW